ncbi:MAG TPA: hypothetical protein DDW74_01555, partial [Porphyromonadaceae bacterium]|nr:hypothetical protein [Porphyromonadaceae bacterium]
MLWGFRENANTFTIKIELKKKMRTFEELGIAPAIWRAIQEMGFEQPMPVQEEVIPQLLANTRDIIAL